MTAETRTTCPYCGVGCGVVAMRDEDGKISVRGDTEHPANFGRLCSKGSALAETLDFDGRLESPIVDGAIATWDVALDRVASGFAETVQKYGPDSVAFYVSGQLLTEDYYVVNKLAKGFIGTANIDTNSRLCMASSVAGHKRAFGSDTVPGCYEDLEQADLIVFAGSNAAWCHPVLYQRMIAAKAANPTMRLVVIDPRRTDTCDGADLHLGLRSGSDAVLFNGLLTYLHAKGKTDTAFVGSQTNGAEAALAAAAGMSVEKTAAICGLPIEDVRAFFEMAAQTEKTVTLYSQGINQSSSGTDKVNAIINCHLLTGRIGRPGMGPFSLTGQPNAMGGREVGGLANQLAAHMEIENVGHRDIVQRFWQAPAIASKQGLKAVDMFDAIAAGRIKAVWIMSTNPLVSLPDADRARAALQACELVVVSDCMRYTDTSRLAHVLLPASAWGEKDGTVTNSERRISRQRSFMAPPKESRADWWAICEVAKRMGFAGFDYGSVADVFREHAQLSGFENGGARDFDISGMSDISDEGFGNLAPIQWPVTTDAPNGTARFFASGKFFTPDRRARFLPVAPRPPSNATDRAFPLVLNTGRVRDHWHTMTRTGKAPRLSIHVFEPYAEFHPFDAKRHRIEAGSLVELATRYGTMVARARIAREQRQGCVFVPMHWNGEFASSGRVNALVNPAVDPVSGQPESKHTPVNAAPFAAAWHCFALTRAKTSPDGAGFWVGGHAGPCWRLELAGREPIGDPEAWARALLNADATASGEWIAYRDPAAGIFRFALVENGRLCGCVFVGPDHHLPPREWLMGLFAKPALSEAERKSLLAGAPRDPFQDVGPIVCSCFGIGRKQIAAAIAGGADSVEAIGETLKAGTNCGSCKPELGTILSASAMPKSEKPDRELENA